MTQKVLKVGSSAAVTIPKKSLKELGIKIGDEVRVMVDADARMFSVAPKNAISPADQRIARLTARFIARYRKDLEELAKK